MSGIMDLLDGRSEFGQDPAFHSVGSFVLGTVVDNDSADAPGQVKVEFTAWEKGRSTCEWIPVLQSAAGKTYGSYALPEVDELVLVGFIGTDMKRPFVMGSFYPAGAQMVSESRKSKNVTHRLKTKAGLTILADEEKGKETYTVTTPKGFQVVISDEKESVTISDKDGKNSMLLDGKNGALTLKAEKKITIQTGKTTIALDGSAGKLEVKTTQLTAEASGAVKIAAKQAMNLEGAMLTAQGKQTATLKGGQMTQVTGGMVKIN